MVRSFLGRFVRSGTEPRIDGDREIEERENALLHTRERHEMTALAPAFANDGQRQSLYDRAKTVSHSRIRATPLR